MTKVILFDIDGTLLASGGAGKVAMMAGLEAVTGKELEPDQVPDFSGRTDFAIVSGLLEAAGLKPTCDRVTAVFQAYLEHLPTALQERPGKILPGVKSLLRELHDSTHVTLGLITGNMQLGAEGKLEHYGLRSFFAWGGFGDRHAHRNDVARSAVAAIPQPAKDSYRDLFVIGDTPHDVTCAKAIGAQSVGVCTGNFSRGVLASFEPDYLCDDLNNPNIRAKLMEKVVTEKQA